jgi:hypothetical protein
MRLLIGIGWQLLKALLVYPESVPERCCSRAWHLESRYGVLLRRRLRNTELLARQLVVELTTALLLRE